MPMTHLAALFVSSGFQPSDESVRRIQEAGEAAVAGWSPARVAVLTRLALGMPTTASDELDWFTGPFQDADRTFTDVGERRKASLYASGLALELLARQDSGAVPLALCLLSASVANRLPSPACPSLVKEAQQHLAVIQQKWRQKPKVELGKVGGIDMKALIEAADQLSANAVPQAGAALKTFSAVLSTQLAALAKQQSALGQMDTHLRLLDEEQSNLWWFIGGMSRDIERPFTEMPAAAAAVVSGHELADMRHHTAGPVAAAALLDMTVKAGRKAAKAGSDNGLAEVCTVDLPPAWRTARGTKARDKGVLDLCPLSAAMLMSAEAGDAPDWRAAFARSHPAADAARLSLLDLAMQAYRERSYLSLS